MPDMRHIKHMDTAFKAHNKISSILPAPVRALGRILAQAFAALDLTRLAGPRLAPVYEAALYERASAYFKGDERASADAQKQIAEKVIRDFSFEKASGEKAEEAKRDWLRITVAKINGSSGL
jgi:hypothetical protein